MRFHLTMLRSTFLKAQKRVDMWLIGIIILWLVLYTIRLVLLSLDAMAGKVLDSLEEQKNVDVTHTHNNYNNLTIMVHNHEGHSDMDGHTEEHISDLCGRSPRNCIHDTYIEGDK